jgi:polyhydroxyalkanoate synthesis regulator phasin
LYHHYDVEIERRVNLLIDLGELSQEEGAQLLDKFLTVNNQSLKAKEYSSDKIFEYYTDHKILTKNDFQALGRKIDAMSRRVDKFSLGDKNE